MLMVLGGIYDSIYNRFDLPLGIYEDCILDLIEVRIHSAINCSIHSRSSLDSIGQDVIGSGTMKSVIHNTNFYVSDKSNLYIGYTSEIRIENSVIKLTNLEGSADPIEFSHATKVILNRVVTDAVDMAALFKINEFYFFDRTSGGIIFGCNLPAYPDFENIDTTHNLIPSYGPGNGGWA